MLSIQRVEEDETALLEGQLESHRICDPQDLSSNAFDRALAAGTGLLDACISSHVPGSVSAVKTLRLVSKAASVLALQAVRGFTLQLRSGPHDPLQNSLPEVLNLVPGIKLTRLQVRFPAMRDQGHSTQGGDSILVSSE